MVTPPIFVGYDGLQMRVDADGVFLEWGEELESVFGYSASDVLGRKVDLLIPPMLRSKHWQGFNKAMAAGRMRRPDIIFRGVGVHKAGHLVPFRSIDVLDFDADGTCVGVTAVILRTGLRSYLGRWTVKRSEPEIAYASSSASRSRSSASSHSPSTLRS